jgi:hypothetical protein
MLIAIVCHDYGNNGYSAETMEELNQKICEEFIAQWYTETGSAPAQRIRKHLDEKNWFRAIQVYFDFREGEKIHYAVA